jgi:sigma-B regulation protein RsbU (phosphoserine phosphatase)
MKSFLDWLLGRTSPRFRTKFILVTTLGVLVALVSSAGTALFNVTRLEQNATSEIRTGIEHANQEYLENYIDTTALRLSLLFEQSFSEVSTTASVFQTLVDNPEAERALGAMSANGPEYFQDRFEPDPNGNWTQTKPGSASVISVWEYLLKPDKSLQPEVLDLVQKNAIFNLVGPAILKNGSSKLQIYYIGPKSMPVMRLSPYTDMAQTFDKLYPGHTKKNYWEFFFPGLYEGWQGWLDDPKTRPIADKELTVSNPYVDAVTGHPIISFFHPLWTKDRKSCAGAVGVDITLTQTADLIQNVKIKSTGFAFLAFSDGNVLALKPEGEALLGLDTKGATSQGVIGLERRLDGSKHPEIKAITMPDNDAPLFKTVRLRGSPDQEPTAYTVVLRRLPAMNFWKEKEPIRREYWVLGFVVPEAELFSTVDSAEKEIRETSRTILLEQIGVAILSLIAVVLGVLFVAKRVTSHLVDLSEAAHRLMNKDYTVRVSVESADEVGRLGATFNAMAGDIEKYTTSLEAIVQERTHDLEGANDKIVALNKQLHAENLRLAAEIDVARRLQMMVLPKAKELQAVPGYDIAAYMRPADEVGGDYYDVLQLDHRIKVGIGDVTGHGLESGVLMLMVQSVARTLLDSGEYDPVRFLSVLNRVIYKNVQRINTDKNLSLLFIDLDGDTATVVGQHEDVLIVRKDGTLERINTLELGLIIGLEPDISEFVATREVSFCAGESIILFTDGITEAEDDSGEQFGLDRLCDSICSRHEGTAGEMLAGVIDDVMGFVNQSKIHDDISILIIKHD